MSESNKTWDPVFRQIDKTFAEADRAFAMADKAFEKEARTGRANSTFISSTEEHVVRFSAATLAARWKNFCWFGRKAFGSLFLGTATVTFKKKP